MVIQATFAPNPFSPAAGKYTGTVTALISGPAESAGAVKLIVSRNGKFSAKFQFLDQTYWLSGRFLAGGSYAGSIHRKKLPNNPIKIELQMDIDGGTINGVVTDTSWSSDPTGAFSASIRTR
jgi:hypothetical protein